MSRVQTNPLLSSPEESQDDPVSSADDDAVDVFEVPDRRRSSRCYPAARKSVDCGGSVHQRLSSVSTTGTSSGVLSGGFRELASGTCCGSPGTSGPGSGPFSGPQSSSGSLQGSLHTVVVGAAHSVREGPPGRLSGSRPPFEYLSGLRSQSQLSIGGYTKGDSRLSITKGDSRLSIGSKE